MTDVSQRTGAISRRMGSDRRLFKQLELPKWQLEAGVYNPRNELVPWGAVAILRLPPDSLHERLGIQFDQSYDDLDFVKVALLELVRSGKRVALVEHVHAPVRGTEIHAEVDRPAAAKDLVNELTEALELAHGDLLWQRFDEDSA